MLFKHINIKYNIKNIQFTVYLDYLRQGAFFCLTWEYSPPPPPKKKSPQSKDENLNNKKIVDSKLQNLYPWGEKKEFYSVSSILYKTLYFNPVAYLHLA